MSANNNGKVNWLESMVISHKQKLELGLALNGGDIEKAKEYANGVSCAGPAAKLEAYRRLGWNEK